MSNCSRRQIRKMLDNISPTYDFLNHMLSLCFDFNWHRYLSKQISNSEKQQISDLRFQI
ncbi:MAG: hypothetical protein GY756_02030 [bacterium]|nr:hypothetical protein [bacterium]